VNQSGPRDDSGESSWSPATTGDWVVIPVKSGRMNGKFSAANGARLSPVPVIDSSTPRRHPEIGHVVPRLAVSVQDPGTQERARGLRAPGVPGHGNPPGIGAARQAGDRRLDASEVV